LSPFPGQFNAHFQMVTRDPFILDMTSLLDYTFLFGPFANLHGL